MNNSKQTVFQKISSYFQNSPGTIVRPKTDYNYELYKTKVESDYNVKKLERQQNKYIKSLWAKANSLIQHITMQNEAKRLPSYYDYEKMEEYPMIAAALDIFMEESTTANDEGDVLNIYSNSERVKQELKILFYDRIHLNANIPMWARNMCKYGDNFVYWDVDGDLGVVGCKQLPNIEIERDEGNFLDYLYSTEQKDVIFRWKTARTVEFKKWQIGHFRLLTSDIKLPYGVSILEKARRIWRNLLLTEDAMRTIRLLRATDRRVFYINVGNIDTNDVEAYLNAVADRYKRKREYDPETGQENLKANVLGIDQDYFIPVRGSDDGSKIDTIQGQTNLDIADVEYDLKLLCTALRVPKTYLNFDDAVAEGKSLSMQDIRFARTVNRIQQSLLQELNKVAILHLIAVGLEDEVNNFKLSLNNPSIQAEILKTDLLTQKVSVYKDLVEPSSIGIAPMSHTKAKKLIFGMSDDDINDDLIQQRIEKAIGNELLRTEQIINRTGFFNDVDKLYGLPNAEYTTTVQGNPIDSIGGSEPLDMNTTETPIGNDLSSGGEVEKLELDGENTLAQ